MPIFQPWTSFAYDQIYKICKFFSVALLNFSPFVSSNSLRGNLVRRSDFKISGFKIIFPSLGESSAIFTFQLNVHRRRTLKHDSFLSLPRRFLFYFFFLRFMCPRDSSFCIAAICELLAFPLFISIEKIFFRYHSPASNHSVNNTATCRISIVHSQ